MDCESCPSLESQFKHWYVPQGDPTWDDLHHPLYRPCLFTASEIPSILGCGYKSPKVLYNEKTGLKPVSPLVNLSPPVQWGKEKEDMAVEEFLTSHKEFYAIRPGLIFHPTRKNIAASADRILVKEVPVEVQGDTDLFRPSWIPLEVKCPWKQLVPSFLEDIPAKWLVQVQVQLACFQAPFGLLYIWRPDDRETYIVQRDDVFLEWRFRQVDRFEKMILGEEPIPESRFVIHWIDPKQNLYLHRLQRTVNFYRC